MFFQISGKLLKFKILGMLFLVCLLVQLYSDER